MSDQDIIDQIVDIINTVLDSIVDTISKIMPSLMKLIKTILDKLPEFMEELLPKILKIAKQIIDAVFADPEFLKALGEGLVGVIKAAFVAALSGGNFMDYKHIQNSPAKQEFDATVDLAAALKDVKRNPVNPETLAPNYKPTETLIPTINIEFNGDLAGVGSALQPAISLENARRGISLTNVRNYR